MRLANALLCRHLTRGMYPKFVRCLTCLVYDSSTWLLDLILRGYAKIALESYTYIISTMFLPLLDVIEDFNICSV